MIPFLTEVIFVFLSVTGCFLLFRVNLLPPKSNRISLTKAAAKAKRVRINAEISLSQFEKIVIHVDALLKKIKKGRQYLYSIVCLCLIAGVTIGYVCFTNAFLAIVTGFVVTPLSYLFLVMRTQESTRKDLAELENTMSIITNSYMASNDVVRAVEMYVLEKNRYIDAEEEATTPFDEFVADCLYLNPNVKQGLDRLAAKMNNRYFSDWVNTLKLCIDNKHMRFALRPIIDAMVDEKAMQMESDTVMAKAWTNYISVVAIMFSVIPVLRIAQKAWYLTLTQTIIGQGFIFAMLIATLLTGAYVMKLNKPVSTT